jgi:hypothetical protein
LFLSAVATGGNTIITLFELYPNVKMDIRGIGWGGMNCIRLAQNWGQWRALVNTVINLRLS